METGAVKQAYNNEVILLKKNFNQARTHIIHKLTRKAKQLAEKKCPEAVKEKLRRKAELAVKEVLAIKKLKARDIGKFIITHKGKLQDYLNKPQVDNDRACARILLHKSMQDKYNFIRTRFLHIPIKDLFMSRQERLQLKKDERLKKKEKQMKKKGIVVNAEGDWDVEDVDKEKLKGKKDNKKVVEEVSDNEQDYQGMTENEASDMSEEEIEQNCKNSKGSGEDCESDEENDGSSKNLEVSAEEDGIEQDISGEEDEGSGIEQDISSEEDVNSGNDGFASGSDDDTPGEGFKISFKGQSDQESDDGSDQDDDEAKQFRKFGKSPTAKPEKKTMLPVVKGSAMKSKYTKTLVVEKELPFRIENQIKTIQSQKSNQKKDSVKNKKLNDKILNKKFKTSLSVAPNSEKKVVDPFFVTETGGNYLSTAEPRAPDEFKDEHRKGNRKIRRAAMFGRVPKIRPRQDFKQGNNKFDRQNGFGKNMNNNLDFSDSKHDRYQRGNDKLNTFSDNKKQRFNDRSEKFNDKLNQDNKPEKLHPSWEAKKKLSGLLPFQGKKIVFDES